MVSFKLPPADVAAGSYDSTLKRWFDKAPRNIDVYWSFWHEPENDIQDGTFTAADYKAAFVHLDKLADTADNPRLKSTVILQSYSTRPESGRNWRNYMPNPGHVDVLAWDVYSRPSPEAGYQVPPDLLDGPIQASRSIGKPFGVAELGSPIAPGDQGSGRAEWLRRMGAYLDQHHALFVCYFDFVWNGGKDDYRLSDTRRCRPGETSAASSPPGPARISATAGRPYRERAPWARTTARRSRDRATLGGQKVLLDAPEAGRRRQPSGVPHLTVPRFDLNGRRGARRSR